MPVSTRTSRIDNRPMNGNIFRVARANKSTNIAGALADIARNTVAPSAFQSSLLQPQQFYCGPAQPHEGGAGQAAEGGSGGMCGWWRSIGAGTRCRPLLSQLHRYRHRPDCGLPDAEGRTLRGEAVSRPGRTVRMLP